MMSDYDHHPSSQLNGSGGGRLTLLFHEGFQGTNSPDDDNRARNSLRELFKVFKTPPPNKNRKRPSKECSSYFRSWKVAPTSELRLYSNALISILY